MEQEIRAGDTYVITLESGLLITGKVVSCSSDHIVVYRQDTDSKWDLSMDGIFSIELLERAGTDLLQESNASPGCRSRFRKARRFRSRANRCLRYRTR